MINDSINGKINIFGMTIDELRNVISDLGESRFRAVQLSEWLYKRDLHFFPDMNNMPKSFIEKLDKKYTIQRGEKVVQLTSGDKKTSKFLIKFHDNVAVETVLMRQSYGNSICISSQAGCNMGCAFCASTINGMERNLTASEMLAQTLYINDLLKKEGEKVDTIVIMGSGEPLINYDNVVRFMRLIHEDYCMKLGYRNITLSTCGIIPGIERLTHEGIPVNLSISLHAPNQEVRKQIMPIANKYDINDVVKAAEIYASATGRRITYEYILIENVNDTVDHAKELVNLLRGQLASVNLIPLNPVTERDWKQPSAGRVEFFKNYLLKNNVTATVRKEMGQDIKAACGQLRNRNLTSL